MCPLPSRSWAERQLVWLLSASPIGQSKPVNGSALAVRTLNSGSPHQPDEKEEHQSPQQGGDDVAAKRFRMNPKARRKQPGNACAENAYDDVADQAKPVTLDKQAGQPSGHSTDNNPGENGLGGKH